MGEGGKRVGDGDGGRAGIGAKGGEEKAQEGMEKASGDWNGVGEELLWDVSRGVGSAFSAPARPAVSPLPTSQPPLQAPVGPDLIPWLGTGPGI